MKPEGDLSIKNIKRFYDDLKDELERGSEIVVDLSNVKRVDLAAVQVIIAAGKSAAKLKKVLRLTGVSGDVKRLFRLSGMKL